MALDITDPAYFERVLGFAKRRGGFNDLRAKLDWLDGYEGRSRSRCVVGPSTSPFSFELVMFQRRGTTWKPSFSATIRCNPMRRRKRMVPTFELHILTVRARGRTSPTTARA